MSYLGQDPGDLTPEQMYGTEVRGVLVERALCGTCRNPDGSLDTEYLDEEGACLFGCGRKVDEDMGMCPHCQDHSANMVECERCGTEYEKWNHTWQRVPR